MLTVTAGAKKGDYMYLAFTEEQAIEIRKLGVSVVEYKMCINKHKNVALFIAEKAFTAVTKVLEQYAICLKDTAGKMFCAIKEEEYIQDKPPVYNFPKLVCKCDIDYMKNKTMPKIKTKLPRSNC